MRPCGPESKQLKFEQGQVRRYLPAVPTLPELRQAIDARRRPAARACSTSGRGWSRRSGPSRARSRSRSTCRRASGRSSSGCRRPTRARFPTDAIRPVFQEIISACLSLEQPLRVAFLGPEATFTHMAVQAPASGCRRATSRRPRSPACSTRSSAARRLRRGAGRELHRGRGQLTRSTCSWTPTSDLRRRSCSRSRHCLLARPRTLDWRHRAGLLASAGAGAVPRAGWPRTCRAPR